LTPEKQNMESSSYEVIVTDDGSDSSAKTLLDKQFPSVRWIEGPKKGPAANRNNGAKNATAQWLIFIDDDVLPDQFLLRSYAEAIQMNGNVKAFEGSILPDNWQTLSRDLAECPVNLTGGCFWSANICIKSDLFVSINGFDEVFRLAAQEDQDLFERLKKKTLVKFLSQSKVIHPVRIVSLTSKCKRIVPQTLNWYLFERRSTTWSGAILRGGKSQMHSLVKSLKSAKPKSSLYHFAVLLLYIPIITFQEIKTNAR
jgi:glycosyltransferase involved in cell wall biosynthesis